MSFPQTGETRLGIGFIFAVAFEVFAALLIFCAIGASILNALMGAWVIMFITLIAAVAFLLVRDFVRDWRRGM